MAGGSLLASRPPGAACPTPGTPERTTPNPQHPLARASEFRSQMARLCVLLEALSSHSSIGNGLSLTVWHPLSLQRHLVHLSRCAGWQVLWIACCSDTLSKIHLAALLRLAACPAWEGQGEGLPFESAGCPSPRSLPVSSISGSVHQS